MTVLYVVAVEPGGLWGAWLDKTFAHETARSIGGVVVELPVTADYRPPPATQAEGSGT